MDSVLNTWPVTEHRCLTFVRRNCVYCMCRVCEQRAWQRYDWPNIEAGRLCDCESFSPGVMKVKEMSIKAPDGVSRRSYISKTPSHYALKYFRVDGDCCSIQMKSLTFSAKHILRFCNMLRGFSQSRKTSLLFIGSAAQHRMKVIMQNKKHNLCDELLDRLKE